MRKTDLGGGSSPLARGLRRDDAPDRVPGGIIPARAGFTSLGPAGMILSWDHPRSRGVYETLHPATLTVLGSSPLARGLPLRPPLLSGRAGIIPARAGFTIPSFGYPKLSPDHPRSRGVYVSGPSSLANPSGSSPLARGLLSPSPACGARHRIIPARAGFTRRP